MDAQPIRSPCGISSVQGKWDDNHFTEGLGLDPMDDT